MVTVRCNAEHTLKLHELHPLQGELKTRTKRNMKELKSSLVAEGLIAPFFVWKGSLQPEGEEKCWILDGHGRHAALKELADEDPKIMWDQDFPVVYINAPDVYSAKKALLQITSQYGAINKEGARKFCEGIHGYRAPSIKCIYRKPREDKLKARAPTVTEQVSSLKGDEIRDGDVVMRIAVPSNYEKAVRDLFMSVSYIKVL